MAYFPPTGSVVAFQSDATKLLVTASVTGTVSVIGTVPVTQSGAWAVSVVGATLSGNPSISGTVLIGNTNVNVAGSVVSFQGTSPWVVNFQNSSILSVPVGSIFAVTEVTRNDTLASIVGADLTIRPQMGDSLGRVIIKPFASEDSTIISYTGSVVSTSVTLIQASAIGKKSYITDFWVANTGATTTLITFQGGDTSVLGYTIAPTAGGSNSPGIAIPLKTTTSQDLAFKATSATSVLYLTVKGYQAP